MLKPNIKTIKAEDIVYCKGFACIPDKAKRTVYELNNSLFIVCVHGWHSLALIADKQTGELTGLSYERYTDEPSSGPWIIRSARLFE